MRLTLIILTSILSLTITGLALAAEPGTYRPGQAYLSLTAPNANLCAAQCNGDAQCKGWNFVRVKSNAATGLCEFNSRRVAPVSSPVSISGDNSSARASSRIIPSGSRTIKVGQPAPQPVAGPRPAAKAAAAPATPPRRVVRRVEPVPQKQMPTPTSYRAPLSAPRPVQAPLSQPAFRHSLDAAPQPPASPRTAAPSDSEMISTVQRRRLEAMVNRPTAPVPSPNALPIPPNPATMPDQMQATGAPVPPRMPQPQPQFPAGMTAQQTEQSLFGSLYDDVSAPNSLTPENLPADENAPIATAKSVPVKKVTVDNLMAGAPNPG